MKEAYEYTQPTLQWSIDSFRKFPQDGINLEVLAEGIKSGTLSSEEQSRLNDTFVKGYNQALRACVPRNAFLILQGQNMIAENIPPQELLDLDQEWQEIAQLAKINISQEEITTEAAFKHFKALRHKKIPEYETICQKISLYISECIRRAHKQKDPSFLIKVIPTFKLLAYLHKHIEDIHYWCEGEFNEIICFSVNQETLEFVFLKKKDVIENDFKEAISR